MKTSDCLKLRPLNTRCLKLMIRQSAVAYTFVGKGLWNILLLVYSYGAIAIIINKMTSSSSSYNAERRWTSALQTFAIQKCCTKNQLICSLLI